MVDFSFGEDKVRWDIGELYFPFVLRKHTGDVKRFAVRKQQGVDLPAADHKHFLFGGAEATQKLQQVVHVTGDEHVALFCVLFRHRAGKHYVGPVFQSFAAGEGAEAYLNDGGKDFDKAAEIAIEELKFGDSISTKGDYKKHLALTYVRRGLEEVSK